MKALVRKSFAAGDVGLMDLPKPQPGPGQVVLKVVYGGICGSDAKVFKMDIVPGGKARPPIALGHEGVGIVSEVGADVTNVKVGDRVAAETTVQACGICRFCRTGNLSMCIDRAGLGTRANGYFAEYVLVRAGGCHVIPEHVDLKAAAVLEPLGCGVKGMVQQARVVPGDVVVVYGPGTIGQCAAQVAKAAGAYVVMVGTPHSHARLEVALKLGIDQVLVTGEQDVPKTIMDMTDGYGADVVCEAVGGQSSFSEALQCVRKLGQYVIMATGPVQPVQIDLRWLFSRQIRMVGAVSCDPISWDISMDLLTQGKVNLAPLVTHVFPLEQWREAIAQTGSHEGIKVLLEP
jgi:L-iditol 2-dehydrogenase